VIVVGPDGAAARVVDDTGGDGTGLLTAVTVGRHASCDLWLDANTASRRHLVIVAFGTSIASVDLRSSLGTISAPLSPAPGAPLVVLIGDVFVVAAVAGPGQALPALPAGPALPEAGLVLRPPPRVSALVHAGVTHIDLPFDNGILIGRSERSDVIVLDEGVSRLHAALLRIDGVPVIVDVGSSNGTHVRRSNGSEVALGPARRACALVTGDVVEVGGVGLAIHDLRAPESRTAVVVPPAAASTTAAASTPAATATTG
jgi:pSer/pThr/pTyr-binding forkhead associated (FHA) protein